MKIPFVIDANLVRGLDYYNHTVFEIMLEGEGFGSITTLSGGGRYNGLVEDLGGPNTPAIGFALSIERLILALDSQNITLPIDNEIDCFFIALGEEAKVAVTSLLYQLRKTGLKGEKDYQDRKLKAQFKAADRLNARYVAVLGEEELQRQVINLKNQETGEQEEVALDIFVKYLSSK
jgi:histidyl-tRNA synthetase